MGWCFALTEIFQGKYSKCRYFLLWSIGCGSHTFEKQIKTHRQPIISSCVSFRELRGQLYAANFLSASTRFGKFVSISIWTRKGDVGVNFRPVDRWPKGKVWSGSVWKLEDEVQKQIEMPVLKKKKGKRKKERKGRRVKKFSQLRRN